MNTLVEAFDLIGHAEVLEDRLATVVAELSTHGEFAEEAAWLASAHRRLARAREAVGDLPIRALRLPELQSYRGERGRFLQGGVVDAVEGLQAAIIHEGGERSPLIEAIYRGLKLPVMRKNHGECERQCAEIEKRLGSSYVTRVLGDPEYAALAPPLSRFRAALAEWRDFFTAEPPEEAEREPLVRELESTAQGIDLAWRQARILVEAVLVTAPDVFDASSILEKSKRRAPKRVEHDANKGPAESPDPPSEEGSVS